ncbi:hypothetical protein Pmani_032603 [Petrolisthes manimaculis]|uniref:Uncharacterized protein n=1 Tax=Petrolisthes manimaculis TaxID=1843537 RepID=A0AAE1TTM4_9EUCA|nr:hypothetical protein Pmani_032603 [Petrolisthes manimaculis]
MMYKLLSVLLLLGVTVAQAQLSCTGFACTDGSCIPSRWVCDSEADCVTGEDEADCATAPSECAGDQYRCDEGTCINEVFHCDGITDCPSVGDDELLCSECTEGFHCNEDTCIPEFYICDEWEDCKHGEDEIPCATAASPATSSSLNHPNKTKAQTKFLLKLKNLRK